MRAGPPPPTSGGAAEPSRYTLLGGLVGVPSFPLYLRTLVDIALWLFLGPLPARFFWRSGARGLSASYHRWWAKRVQRALAIEIDWEGLDQIDPGQTYLVAPLHEGFADAVALLQLPLALRFVVREELLGWPLLGPYLRDTEQIAIDPEAGGPAYRALLRAAQAVVAAGESLLLFPQGSILGLEIDLRRGPVALARALDLPILPIALTGSHRVWEYPYTPRLRRRQRISLRVLPPIPVVEVRAAEPEALRRRLRDDLKGAALDGRMAPPRRFDPDRDGYWPGYGYLIDPAFPELAARIAAFRRGEVEPARTPLAPAREPGRREREGSRSGGGARARRADSAGDAAG